MSTTIYNSIISSLCSCERESYCERCGFGIDLVEREKFLLSLSGVCVCKLLDQE